MKFSTLVIIALLSLGGGCNNDQDKGYYRILYVEGCEDRDRIDHMEVVVRNCENGDIEIYRPKFDGIDTSSLSAPDHMCGGAVGMQYYYDGYGNRSFKGLPNDKFADPATFPCPEYVYYP